MNGTKLRGELSLRGAVATKQSQAVAGDCFAPDQSLAMTGLNLIAFSTDAS